MSGHEGEALRRTTHDERAMHIEITTRYHLLHISPAHVRFLSEVGEHLGDVERQPDGAWKITNALSGHTVTGLVTKGFAIDELDAILTVPQ